MIGDIAGRAVADRADSVGAAGRATRDVAAGVKLDIGFDLAQGNGVATRLLVFERPLLDSAVNLAKVVDTGVLLRGRAGLNEVRDRNGRQQTDDRHDDHDFNQCEASFGFVLNFHINRFFAFCSVTA